MTNNNYGKLINNQIQYAPTYFNTDTGIILNPTEEMYLSKGWYKVIDERPEANPGCYVKFNGYEEDHELKTITFDYIQIMIPVIREVYVYSKLKLEMALFKLNLLEKFDNFLDETFITNEFGTQLALRRFYDQANDLKSDNEYFETYKKLGQEKLGLTDEQLEQILEASKADS